MKKSSKRLSPSLSNDVINDLGGTTVVAGICNLSKPAISLKKKKGITDPYVRFLREKYKRLPIMKHDEIRNF